jgi:large subunit ribosomal protein L1
VVGKLSFSEPDLEANIHAFIEHIKRMKPASAKGHFIRKICISGTMTPSVMIEAGVQAGAEHE